MPLHWYDAAVAIGTSPNVAERKRFAMEILNSSVDSSAWENAVLIQGILGWVENRFELMELVTRQEEVTPVSPPVFRAKLQSLVALGMLLKNSNDPQARSDISRFFMKVLDDPDWISKLKWQSPFHQDKVEL